MHITSTSTMPSFIMGFPCAWSGSFSCMEYCHYLALIRLIYYPSTATARGCQGNGGVNSLFSSEFRPDLENAARWIASSDYLLISSLFSAVYWSLILPFLLKSFKVRTPPGIVGQVKLCRCLNETECPYYIPL